MKHCLLILLCLPLRESLRLNEGDAPSQKYPQLKAGCGAIMTGGGSDDYVLQEMKVAQRLASLKMPEGWCAKDPTLTHVPVVYFHDRETLTKEMVSERLRSDGVGTEMRFELFYMGSMEQPIMENFEPIPKMFPKYFKWARPQIFQLSPFNTTLSLDGDAVPCSGEKLALAFKFFADSGKSVAAPKWMSGINMGFIIFDTEAAKPMNAAWARQIKNCIEKHGEVTHDQNAMATVFKKGVPVSVAHFSDHNICRRVVKTKGCATPSCWVDHRARQWTYEQRISSAEMPQMMEKSSEYWESDEADIKNEC